MNKQWGLVGLAALFEVMWVVGLKHSDSLWEWAGTAVAVFVSFGLMIRAARTLPVSTVYAVFVGLGTTGTVLSEILLLGKPMNAVKLAQTANLLMGVIGLKLVTPAAADSEKGGESS